MFTSTTNAHLERVLLLSAATWLVVSILSQPVNSWRLAIQDSDPTQDNDDSNYINSRQSAAAVRELRETDDLSNDVLEATAPSQQEEGVEDIYEEVFVLEDKDYPTSLYENYSGVGQPSGITTLPSGDVVIFHRSERTWNEETFWENNNTLKDANPDKNLIRNDTIMILDRTNGSAIKTFGSDLFYMPHGIISDSRGNLWVTDVGRHQVMRLPTSQLHLAGNNLERWLSTNFSRLWPDIILGGAFVPGSDPTHFCQPADIEISSDDRLVFVADGYCNSRILVFTGKGRLLGSIGDDLGMKVVHSLTLIESRNLLCAADRENSRILCFRAGLDDEMLEMGKLVVSLVYPLGKVYAIESLGDNHLLVSSRQIDSSRYDLAALNPFTRGIKQIWTSTDLSEPHAMTKTRDGQFIYVTDLSKDAYKKVFKFNVILRQQLVI